MSNIGTWFHNVASAVVVFEITGSALMVGAVVSAQFVPVLVLFPWTGLLTDKHDRRVILLIAQSVAAVAAGTLAAAVGILGLDGMALAWMIFGASVFIGIGKALAEPSMNALLPALVDRSRLDQAIALNNITFQLARAIGPAVGALLLVWAGVATSFAVNAATYAFFVVVLVRLQPLGSSRSASTDHSLRAGLVAVSRDPVLVVLLVAVATIGFGTDPINTLSPALADRLVPIGPGAEEASNRLVGFMISAFGSGAAVAAFSLHWIRRRVAIASVGVGGLVLTSVAMTGAAFSTHALGVLIAFGFVGVGALLAVTSFTTLIQFAADERVRGRVMAIWGVAFLGSRPLAALIDGSLADAFGIRPAMVTLGVIPLVVLVVLKPWIGRVRRSGKLDDPQPWAGRP